MKNITQIILRTYLRRWPIHLRKSQFNLLTRYSWLKSPLEEVRDEFFSNKDEPVVDEKDDRLEEEPSEVLLSVLSSIERLQGESISGVSSTYRLTDSVLKRRGNGYLLAGIDESSNQQVTIKYYPVPSVYSDRGELAVAEKNFQNIVRLSHPDNQPQEDLRVVWPSDAIADSQENNGYFLILDEQNNGQTLQQWLIDLHASLPPEQVRNIIGQVLQSLMHLHHQPVRLASHRLQPGLVHGNLSLESVLRVERAGEAFFYLSDLALWESSHQWGRSASSSRGLIGLATPEAIQQDLADLAALGWSLVQHEQDSYELQSPPCCSERQDEALEKFLVQLGDQTFQDTVTAWQAWLRLEPLKIAEKGLGPRRGNALENVSKPKKKKRWPLLAGGSLLALLALTGGWWWWRSRPLDVTNLPDYIEDVQQVPAGEFSYALISSGSWDRALLDKNYFDLELSIEGAIESVHEEFSVSVVRIGCSSREYSRKDSIDYAKNCIEGENWIQEAIHKVGKGDVSFAIIPMVEGLNLPSELGYEVIAYDGLAAVVPFSYGHRLEGLPKAREGKISLSTLNETYSERASFSSESGKNYLARYIPRSVEAIQVFSQTVLNGNYFANNFDVSSDFVSDYSTHQMLSHMLKEFEGDNNIASIGFASFSDVAKECSVYPLAISADGKEAVQPMITRSENPISPEINLCDDKTLYYPDVEAFKHNRYPLAYPIVVIFPQDNSQAIAGQKFSEMMQTKQAQQLLLEAGLVPIVDAYELARASITQTAAVSVDKQKTVVVPEPIPSMTYSPAPVQAVQALPVEADSYVLPEATPASPNVEPSAIGAEILTGVPAAPN